MRSSKIICNPAPGTCCMCGKAGAVWQTEEGPLVCGLLCFQAYVMVDPPEHLRSTTRAAEDKPAPAVRGETLSSRPQKPVQELRAVATPVQGPVFEPMRLPRRDNGRLDFPRWSCAHQTCIAVLSGHGGSLSKVVNECRALGLHPDDEEDMLDQWSWTWICSTAVWLRALRGSETWKARCSIR